MNFCGESWRLFGVQFSNPGVWSSPREPSFSVIFSEGFSVKILESVPFESPLSKFSSSSESRAFSDCSLIWLVFVFLLIQFDGEWKCRWFIQTPEWGPVCWTVCLRVLPSDYSAALDSQKVFWCSLLVFWLQTVSSEECVCANTGSVTLQRIL